MLSTFAPPHCEIHLEKAHIDQGTLSYLPGTVIFASYVPQRQELSAAEHGGPEDSESSAHSEPDVSLRSASPQDDNGIEQSSAASSEASSRSRSERAVTGRWAGPPQPQPVHPEATLAPPDHAELPAFSAVFMLLTPEYKPEVVRLTLPGPLPFSAAQQQIQEARAAPRRTYFPWLQPAVPQPIGEYVLLLALPGWTTDLYIVLDCSQVDQRIFCTFATETVDRNTLFALAGFAPDAPLDVYVPDLLGPLGDTESARLQLGQCVSFLPRDGGLLVVTTVDDRLQDPSGWLQEPALPVSQGYWIQAMHDSGSDRLLLSPERRRFVRQEVQQHLELTDNYVLQPARPPLEDSCDRGIPAVNVYVVSEDPRLLLATPDLPQVVFIFDARPLTCGITWGFAPDGCADEQAILAQCNASKPPGYRTCLLGGHRDVFGVLRVGAGEVIVACFLTALGSLPEEAEPPGSQELSEVDADTQTGAASTMQRNVRARHATAAATAGPTTAPDRDAAASLNVRPSSARVSSSRWSGQGALCGRQLHSVPGHFRFMMWSLVALATVQPGTGFWL